MYGIIYFKAALDDGSQFTAVVTPTPTADYSKLKERPAWATVNMDDLDQAPTLIWSFVAKP